MSPAEPPRRRGRPQGSVGLTAEKENQVLTLVRGGASLRSAAQAAGIPIRTLQSWIARGESKESSTRKLRRFSKEVQRAKAEARVSAEVRLHQAQPGRWLHDGVAGLDASADETSNEEPLSAEDLRRLAKQLRDTLLYQDPSETVPACPNRRCRCMFHRQRTPAELAAIRAMLEKASTL